MAYTASVVVPLQAAERISRKLGIVVGKCNVTAYHTTLAEITSITKFFIDVAHTSTNFSWAAKGVISVSPCGMSDNGHIFEWDATTGAFKCYRPTYIVQDSTLPGSPIALVSTSGASGNTIHATSGVGVISGVGVEASNDEDCGEVKFIAIGFIR